MQTKTFQKKIWNFYKTGKRNFPWRETTDFYKILVSEVMLQQTQTHRVVPKYHAFLEKFPSIQKLANSSNEDVLRLWSGLGYNRRALFLKRAAEAIIQSKENLTPEFLVTLPGIGPNTAGSIYVFSTNKPHVFIETNIRRVFIHEFFKDQEKISDKSILEFVEKTIDKKQPRDWYYALMDYGSYLAKKEINPNRKSKNYVKQSRFEGSTRQTRGKILKILFAQNSALLKDIEKQFENKENFQKALSQLEKEGFIRVTAQSVQLAS